jgi:NAD-dependent dihydropyrimidine dehydrogenase PreA subunit
VTAARALHVVLYEGTGSAPLEGGERYAIMLDLLQRGYRVTATGRAAGAPAAATPGAMIVVGRFEAEPPRLADAATGVTVHFRNLGAVTPDAVLSAVQEVEHEAQTPAPGKWKPWFPVIDFNRCTNCMQCLTFCLFDVYGVSADRKIRVQNPSNCKTDCPACSRVCPEVAILFPKYKAGPINGDEVREEDVHREKMKVDISALLGGDIYAALRQRSVQAKERFARERDDKRALDERRKCLAKLQQQLDIPPEVLAALPNADQIRLRTEQALAGREPEA